MSAQTALALVPVNPRTDARFKSLGEELVYAWDRTDSRVAKQWAVSTVGTFGVSLKRRASNLFKLVGQLSVGAAAETVAAVVAYRQDRFAGHLGGRAGAAYASSADVVMRVKVATSQAARLVQSHPREAVPQLLVLVVTSIAVSGGPDGDGGAPDLDLMFGIDAHRSILTHSVLMGAALETGFLSLVQLVRLLHAKLPVDHDPLWDSLAKHADSVAQAANAGASIGTSYHLLVDGLLQPAAYHDLPVSLPMEAHQSVFVVNAVAEAVDVAQKPGSASARPASTPTKRRQKAEARSFAAPTPVLLERSTAAWWQTAPAADVAAANAEHQMRRAESMLIDPFVADMLADAELLIIERDGSWLEGLASGTLQPLSRAEERFVQAAKGKCAPETDHEQAWVMYRGLLEYAPATS